MKVATPKPKTSQRERERVSKATHLTRGMLEKVAKEEIAALKKELVEKKKVGKPKGSKAFQSVVRAKELMAESSAFAVRMLKKASKVAASKGDSRPAEFLLKHVGHEEDGKLHRPLTVSVDKTESAEGAKAPVINIGFITAPPERKQLPAAKVIDVLPE